VLDHRYRMLEKAGEGGMCIVYLAEDKESGRSVAIKVLLPALLADPVSMARLRREAALAGKLEHPNVCHVMRLGETSDGFDYAVMPYLVGDLLCDRVARAGNLPLPATVGFVRDMCAGLAHAHTFGIIHRDLKPENIMILTLPDGTERAVVMDFSLATAHDVEKLTAVGRVVGTPEFMSPEQLRGEEVDTRSDIYSLACMAYEMLTGQLPFEGQTMREVMIARLKGALVPIRLRRPDLGFPASVERVFARAMAHDVEDRYPNARAFGDALARAATGGDAEAEGRLRHWIRVTLGR
jgi:serine/threonine protein kinase